MNYQFASVDAMYCANGYDKVSEKEIEDVFWEMIIKAKISQFMHNFANSWMIMHASDLSCLVHCKQS